MSRLTDFDADSALEEKTVSTLNEPDLSVDKEKAKYLSSPSARIGVSRIIVGDS
jgi:hypothetical protein